MALPDVSPSYYQTRNSLKGYFEEGDFPTQSQFGALIDAFYHRSEDQAPISFINGLSNALEGMASQTSVAAIELVLDVIAGQIEALQTESQIIEKSYEELGWLIATNSLVSGKFYKQLNFRQGYNLYDPCTSEIIELGKYGPVEPLILFATSNNTFARAVFSPEYPQDKILYDFEGLSLIDSGADDLGYPTGADTNVWKGVIYYRHDLKQNVSAWYDFRHIEYRTWAIKGKAWSSTVSYQVGNVVQSVFDGNLYLCKFANAGMAEPSTNTTQWLLLYDINTYKYWSCTASELEFNLIGGINGVIIDNLDFVDTTTFDIFYQDVYNVHIGMVDLRNNITYQSSLPNIVFAGYLNHNNNRNNITIGSNSIGLRFAPVIANCNIGSLVRWCIFSINFNNNNLVNNISYNLFQEGVAENDFGSNIHNNVITTGFNNNKIMRGLTAVKLPKGCMNNTFTCNVAYESMYSSSFACANYETQIMRNSDGELKLVYLNNAGVFTVKGINSF
ncbi:MAG: hypothetical protein PHW82_14870 [Bacteroidales bacterium]|nr:hypothetical protein [Bacteroidales bacterium]